MLHCPGVARFQSKWLEKPQTDKRRQSRLALPKLDKTGALPEELRRLLRGMPAMYSDPTSRKRLLAGIAPGEAIGLDRMNMIVLLWTFKCVAKWTGPKSGRDADWNAARNLAKAADKRRDAADAQGLRHITAVYTDRWPRMIEAYAALGFARRCGFANHSLALWRPFEGALMSEVHVTFDRASYEKGDRMLKNARVNPVFAHSEQIRLRLINLRRQQRQNATFVDKEADRIFSILHKTPFAQGLVKQADRPANWDAPSVKP